MSTKRETIDTFRKMLQEAGADSTYPNRQLYHVLLSQSKWLIKREIHSGRIYSNNAFFQNLGCVPVIETSTVDPCCPVKVNCKIYRTRDELPEMWIDNDGPVVKTVTSVDGTTEFFITSAQTWQNKRKDPYNQMSDTKYAFFANNYFWFPENNPHYVNINGFYTDDISEKSQCKDKPKDCKRFLDTEFQLPGWLHSEMFAKALQQLIPSKQMQEDAQIDKNTNRKN